MDVVGAEDGDEAVVRLVFGAEGGSGGGAVHAGGEGRGGEVLRGVFLGGFEGRGLGVGGGEEAVEDGGAEFAAA